MPRRTRPSAGTHSPPPPPTASNKRKYLSTPESTLRRASLRQVSGPPRRTAATGRVRTCWEALPVHSCCGNGDKSVNMTFYSVFHGLTDTVASGNFLPSEDDTATATQHSAGFMQVAGVKDTLDMTRQGIILFWQSETNFLNFTFVEGRGGRIPHAGGRAAEGKTSPWHGVMQQCRRNALLSRRGHKFHNNCPTCSLPPRPCCIIQ